MSARNVPDENEGNQKVPQLPLKFNWRQMEKQGQLLLRAAIEALQNR